MANETQRDCRVCHGKISINYDGKPPFIEHGINYLRRQVTKARYAPLYDYIFFEDIYPTVRYNRVLKKISHRKRQTKRANLIPKYTSVFMDYNPKNDSSDSRLKIAARNNLKYFCRNYEVVEFTNVDLKTVTNEMGRKLVYFQLKFDVLHLRELPDFLDQIANSNYFSLKNDPSIKYVASNDPLNDKHQHYYRVIQEGIIHPEEFDL